MLKKIYSALLTAALILFCTAGSLHAPTARASGFPTVDIAALIQRVTSYMTQLQDYAAQLTSTETEISQLVQLYEDYEQVLREYQHYLRQLRGLENFISDADWRDLMAFFAPYYGASDFAALATLDPDSATFESDVRALLSQYTTVPRDAADFDARLASIDAEAPHYRNENTRLSAAYSRQLDLIRQVARNEDDAIARDEDIDRLSGVIENLGDESDVATMQTMATALEMLLVQQQSAIRLQNQQLLNTELPSAQRAADRAAALDREISRLEVAMSSPANTFTVDVNDF